MTWRPLAVAAVLRRTHGPGVCVRGHVHREHDHRRQHVQRDDVHAARRDRLPHRRTAPPRTTRSSCRPGTYGIGAPLTSPATPASRSTAPAPTRRSSGRSTAAASWSPARARSSTVRDVTLRDGRSGSAPGGNVLVQSSASLTLQRVRITNGRGTRGGGHRDAGRDAPRRLAEPDRHQHRDRADAQRRRRRDLHRGPDLRHGRDDPGLDDHGQPRAERRRDRRAQQHRPATDAARRDARPQHRSRDRRRWHLLGADRAPASRARSSPATSATFDTGSGTVAACRRTASCTSGSGDRRRWQRRVRRHLRPDCREPREHRPAARGRARSRRAAAGARDPGGQPRRRLRRLRCAHASISAACRARRARACDAGAYEFNPPPETTVDGGGPPFAFGASDAGSTFECSLDGGPFVPCTSPWNEPVAPGTHTLTVRAIDPQGNIDGTPVTRTFVVAQPQPQPTPHADARSRRRW